MQPKDNVPGDEFNDEEKKLLTPFVTNLNKSIFVLKNLPEVVKGALFSRYSRTTKSLRRVLLDEFMLSNELNIKEKLQDGSVSFGGLDSLIQTRKAEEFYERVLVGYGDDSVAELAGAHIAIEDVSILATKTLQDARLGLSPLEKSTRYVYFDVKQNNKWRYYRDPKIMESSLGALYEETADFCFETYSELIPKVSQLVMESEPMSEGVTERAYKSTIRAKTCDILRGLLPASTLTNMGFFGNGRSYEYLLTKLYGSFLTELNEIADSMHKELSSVIPSFVKRANDRYGLAMQQYNHKIDSAMEQISAAYETRPMGSSEVALIDYDKDAERKVIAYSLYSYFEIPLTEVYKIVDKMSAGEKKAVILQAINQRDNRRQKPGRAFELPYYSFDVCANFGAYRDMHRHRILTQQRQQLTPLLGYKKPKEISEYGLDREFDEVMERTKETYQKVAEKFKKEAQYVVPLAYNIRWHMTYNLREAYHMLELRSAMQGHVDYREISQKMYEEIKRVHPILAEGMKFIDMKEYSLERLEAEKKIDKKLEEINKKYGN